MVLILVALATGHLEPLVGMEVAEDQNDFPAIQGVNGNTKIDVFF